jgi:glycosyltransferase involved in cell wall biosynthesis
MYKAVHIQYSVDSAGSAALRLQKAFKKEGIDSNIISLKPNDYVDKDRIRFLNRIQRVFARLDNMLQLFFIRHRVEKFGLFSYPILGTNVAKLAEVKNADIIYIHWALDGFLNLRSIGQLARLNKPVIIFMHDMWSITGGCHYSFTCEKYKTGCGECQMFSTVKKNDLSAREFNSKAKLYSKYSNLYFVSPSKWLYDCARQSLLTKDKPLFYIPNLLDTTLFKPFDKNTAKQILNIDTSEKVIAFGAVSVDSPYKGWSYLQKAMEILAEDKNFLKITVLIFGSGYKKEIADAIPFKTKFMGYLNDQYSTLMVYNAADVFVAPSLAETFGYVVLESLSCGTPVVGFDVGGIPDMIKHKENGYLAKYKDAADIAEGIKFCLINQLKGGNSQIFESKEIVNKHLKLFNLLINLK